MFEPMARNIMAKQEQSNSQLAVPQKTMVMISRHCRWTEVIRCMIRSTSATASPLGRRRIALDTPMLQVRARKRGRS